MSQERWDVVIRWLDGPLSTQADQVYRGPVVRLGANPGPGGTRLNGYRGLDARHAVITSYEGGTVSIAPVGTAQIRVAPHEHVDWSEILPLRNASYLSEGAAIHLGPVERGATFTFVESRRLGVWEHRRILSDASQATPDVQPSEVRALSTERGVPPWFIGGMVLVGLVTAAAITFSVVRGYFREIEPLGPVAEGEATYRDASSIQETDVELREGLDQPFYDFVMEINAENARQPELAKNRDRWDERFLDYVTRSFQLHAEGWRAYERLEEVVDHYAQVVEALREARMPEVFAAIPYQESRYRSSIQSFVCARGWWQFMPETAKRLGLQVRGCTLENRDILWEPTRFAPVRNVRKRADYVENDRCIIERCQVDERTDLHLATRAAIDYMREPMEDPELRLSGAVVQLSILSFNAGYDDSRFTGRTKRGNILPAYRRYLEENDLNRGPSFAGDNIRCPKSSMFKNDMCGGYIYDQTQHYAYSVVAEHFLAACYYGLNHSDKAAFAPYRDYVRGDGYCGRLAVPERATILKRMGQ